MANYICNRVICRKEILDDYFIDYDPFGDNTPLDHPYISFNKLFGVKSLNEYDEQYGEHIYYGWGVTWEEREKGLVEIKFLTRWEYPICAIMKAIEIAHDTEWYAVEEYIRLTFLLE